MIPRSKNGVARMKATGLHLSSSSSFFSSPPSGATDAPDPCPSLDTALHSTSSGIPFSRSGASIGMSTRVDSCTVGTSWAPMFAILVFPM